MIGQSIQTVYFVHPRPRKINTYIPVFDIVKLREGQRVDSGRSLKGHLKILDDRLLISFPYTMKLFDVRAKQCTALNNTHTFYPLSQSWQWSPKGF